MQTTMAMYTRIQVTAGRSTITVAGIRSLNLAPIFLKRHKAKQAKASKTDPANPTSSALPPAADPQSGLLRRKILIRKHRTARAAARRASGFNSFSAAAGIERERVLHLAAVAAAEENGDDVFDLPFPSGI